ncbi:hypothetical protein C2E23DRAFT_832372 [Lenzites betulinus]|nr:hypothetical protein C2E23DRAFT_832372 [Lenzites betulinus]
MMYRLHVVFPVCAALFTRAPSVEPVCIRMCGGVPSARPLNVFTQEPGHPVTLLQRLAADASDSDVLRVFLASRVLRSFFSPGSIVAHIHLGPGEEQWPWDRDGLPDLQALRDGARVLRHQDGSLAPNSLYSSSMIVRASLPVRLAGAFPTRVFEDPTCPRVRTGSTTRWAFIHIHIYHTSVFHSCEEVRNLCAIVRAGEARQDACSFTCICTAHQPFRDSREEGVVHEPT